jgi:hypothetical protein
VYIVHQKKKNSELVLLMLLLVNQNIRELVLADVETLDDYCFCKSGQYTL